MTTDGLGKGSSEGLAGIGLSTLDSFSEAMKHPMDTYAALTDLYKTTSFQQALGAASGEFKANLDKLGEDLEIGGDDKAEDLGYRFGKALATAVALIAAPQGDAAMGAKALADLGVTVSSKAYTALRAKVVVEDVGDIPVVGAKEIQAGAGGTWNVLDEIASPNVVKQASPTACGAACGEMLLKDRGVLTTQVDLGTELTSMNSLVRKLNTVDSGWVGNAVDVSSFNALNKTGSWSAMMWDSGNKVGHWVVVDGVDGVGRVLIKDPFDGTQYKMGVEEFKDVWNGHPVYNQ